MEPTNGPSIGAIQGFLETHHGQPAERLAPLDGGFWSTAYGYEVAGNDFVFRLSALGEGFKMDQAAHQFTTDLLPIPEVLEVGEGLGRWFAISRRARGRFLEDITVEDASAAGPMVDRLLSSLRSTTTDGQTVDWFGGRPGSWRHWLERLLIDNPSSTVQGWRPKIADDPQLDSLYRRSEARILELLEQCPERRDLLHGDLLHQNVLVSDSASQVNAVFSWKCSVLGDHLYDVAWLSFWEPWHPGIQQLDAWTRTASQPIEGDDMHDAEIRHHCYELHVGVQHLAWCSWTGNAASLAGVALRTAHVLERGPRSLPELR